MLKKIMMVVVAMIVAIATIVGVSEVKISNNETIIAAEEQLTILESTNEKDIAHELVIDNLSFMLNGMTKDKAMELGLEDNEVVMLSKDSDITYSDIAIISFNNNNMLIYNTKSMLNNDINNITNSIVTMTILLVIMSVFAIAIVATIVIDHIEDAKHAKKMAELRAKRERKAEIKTILVEAEAVLAEACELEANIVDNDIYVNIMDHIDLIHYMKIVYHTTDSEDIQKLKNAMNKIIANI